MYSVTKLIHFCYGHRLLDYQGKCRRLHGHNGTVEITIDKPRLDSRGIAMDFEDIKSIVQLWIDAELDHRTILSAKDPLVPVLRKLEEPVVTLPGNPTAEAIAKHIFDTVKSRGVPVASVKLWENPTSCAGYREAPST
ncbi:MAG: 6-carboxytetrahydropterin synthase [Elusimicrobia bacterium]|nr:6-carboxytetrahydropterin synthase [Elusimicrobiota bacterium]